MGKISTMKFDSDCKKIIKGYRCYKFHLAFATIACITMEHYIYLQSQFFWFSEGEWKVRRSLRLKENISLFTLNLDIERDPIKISLMRNTTKDFILGKDLTILDMV